MLNPRIIIVGKAGSGKDFLKSKLVEAGYKREVSFTTRPPREGEENGVHYYFIHKDQFVGMIKRGDFYEQQEFNGWYYGTSVQQWRSSQVFIFTPSGVKDILEEDRKNCFIIFLDIPIEIRKERLELRSDADKVERRIAADEEDFKDFTDFDIRITNSDF
jgi:guanylate kinase